VRPLPSNGRLLQAVAVAHAVVGGIVHRKGLTDIGRAGVVGSIPYRGPRATAFWFLMPSPLCWIIGGLMHRAELGGDAEALREASRLSLASALFAVICLPVSGFWAWLGISIRGLRDARRMGS
jgi:hypothetical protein